MDRKILCESLKKKSPQTGEIVLSFIVGFSNLFFFLGGGGGKEEGGGRFLVPPSFPGNPRDTLCISNMGLRYVSIGGVLTFVASIGP